MYNSNTDSLGLILGVEVFFYIGHCSGALWGAFNQEKALVGAFSVIVKTGCGADGSFYSTSTSHYQLSW